MNIACPSYNRYETIGKKTLTFLLTMNGVSRDNVTIFVADKEQYNLYTEHNPGWKVVIGEKGIVNIRNFINKYYDKDAYVVSIDDDVTSLLSLDDAETNNLFIDAKKEMDMTGLTLWGVNPVKNKFFMKGQDKITHNLKFCIGVLHGFINKRFVLPIETAGKEDYVNTIFHYSNYGGVIRFNHICPETVYFATGGIGSKKERRIQNEIAFNYIIDNYERYASARRRKDGTGEIRLNWGHRFPLATA